MILLLQELATVCSLSSLDAADSRNRSSFLGNLYARNSSINEADDLKRYPTATFAYLILEGIGSSPPRRFLLNVAAVAARNLQGLVVVAVDVVISLVVPREIAMSWNS